MLTARIGRELVVRAPNEPGSIATLAKLIADHGVNIDAVCSWVEGEEAVIRLVTEDNLRVSDDFRDKNIKYKEIEVVLVDLANKTGMMRYVTEAFAERAIEIKHLYLTTTPDQERCLLVCSTAHNERAMVALNEYR